MFSESFPTVSVSGVEIPSIGYGTMLFPNQRKLSL